MGGVFLNAGEQIKRGARARGVSLCLQAHAHDAVEHEGEEADQGVGADAIRQTVMDRRYLDIGFKDSESTFDIRERLVPGDGLGGGEVGRVGQEGKFAVEEFRGGNSIIIERPGEPVSGVIGFEEAGQFGLGDGAEVLAPARCGGDTRR